MIASVQDDSNTKNEKIELNSDTISDLWQQYIQHIKPNALNAYINIVQQQLPKVIDNKIILEVSNNINLEMLQLNKSTIVAYFLQCTNAKSIELEVKLVKVETELTTAQKRPRDRAKELYEKSESVRYLIQKFDLTLDA